jgi:hypothetical protein
LKWTLKQVQGDGFFYNQRNHLTTRHPELVSGSIRRFILPKMQTQVSRDAFMGAV